MYMYINVCDPKILKTEKNLTPPAQYLTTICYTCQNTYLLHILQLFNVLSSDKISISQHFRYLIHNPALIIHKLNTLVCACSEQALETFVYINNYCMHVFYCHRLRIYMYFLPDLQYIDAQSCAYKYTSL